MFGKIYMAMTDERASGMTLYQFGCFATDRHEEISRITIARHINSPWNEARVWTVVRMWNSYNIEEDYEYMRELIANSEDTLGVTEIERKAVYTLEDQQMFIDYIDELFSLN